MLSIIIGLISGMISGTGMGGGTILILCLSLFLNINQKVAQATNLIFFIPTSISATMINYKKGKIDFNVSKVIITSGIVGSIIGAIIAQKIKIKILKKIFGIFLAIIALHEIYILIHGYKNNKICNTKIKNDF